MQHQALIQKYHFDIPVLFLKRPELFTVDSFSQEECRPWIKDVQVHSIAFPWDIFRQDNCTEKNYKYL